MSKRCAKCQQTKPEEQFSPDRRSSDGRAPRCRECRREDRRAKAIEINEARRAQYALDPSKQRERSHAYYHANRDAEREKRRALSPEQREAARRRARDWYIQNQERHADASRSWRAANRQHKISTEQNRRARAGRYFDEEVDRLEVLRRYDGLCGICGSKVDPENFDVDHIVPVSKSGRHSYVNTQPAHRSCNAGKKNRLREPKVRPLLGAAGT